MTNANQHPIESLMKTAMENIKEMVEVNTVIGDAIETENGTIIMPITKIALGFTAGGAEYGVPKEDSEPEDGSQNSTGRYPFGGGSGAGISVQTVAFMVMDKDSVKMLHVNYHFGTMAKIMEEAPNLMTKFYSHLDSKAKSKKGQKHSQEGKIITKVLEFDE